MKELATTGFMSNRGRQVSHNESLFVLQCEVQLLLLKTAFNSLCHFVKAHITIKTACNLAACHLGLKMINCFAT